MQLAAVLHVLFELTGVALAKFVNAGFDLLFLNIVVLFVFASAGQPLPGEGAAQEVEQHVPDRLEVVATALLVPQMRADGSVARRARQVLPLAVGDVLALRVLVALRQSKVDDVDVIFGLLRSAD